MALGLRGGCSPTALPLSFWEGFYSPVSVTEFRVAEVPLAGQMDMQQWSSSSVAGGLVTLSSGAGWLQVLRPGRVKTK